MVTTTGVVVVWIAGVLLIGAVVGVLVGFLSTYLVRLRIRRPWRDAATGSIALFALNLLGNSVDNGVTFSDGHALGWRGLILNH